VYPFASIVTLLNQPLRTRTFYPKVYRAASGEIFTISLVLTWTMTLIWFPDQIFKHPARFIIGSFNPCFGWDYAPASLFGLGLCSFNVFLLWRYAWLEATRTNLKNPSGQLSWAQLFAKFSAILLALSSNTWLLLWIVGPTDGNWAAHTGLFMLFAVASQLSCLGNYLEARTDPKRASKITKQQVAFQWVYGLVTTYIALAYVIACFLADPDSPPAVPAWVTQSADIVWLICQGAVLDMTPADLPLTMILRLATEEEEKNMA